MTESTPENALAAVTNPDPYPFYAALVQEKPLYFDAALNLWVASSAEVVTAVLTSDLCRVRPLAEPVPRSLLDSRAGRIFAALVRMTDGAGHCPLKKAVNTTLDDVNLSAAHQTSLHWARHLSDNIMVDQLPDFAFQLPAYVVADLLGVPHTQLQPVALLMADFVRCLSPISTPHQIEQGKLAADQLFDRFQKLLDAGGSGLLFQLSQSLTEHSITNNDLVIANAIGFISQAYEATAGCIGNALLALAAHPDLYRQIASALSLLPPFVDEVTRHDSPVHNTRRFLAADGLVAGQHMQAGDAILLVLAAANRDPAVNPHPQTFDMFRQSARCFTFGKGVHQCPGQSLAKTITCAALEHLITSGFPVHTLAATVTYRPSHNTRIPS